MKHNRDTVLFLGAGFSCYAGLPTMAMFGEASDNAMMRARRDGPRLSSAQLNEAGVTFKKLRDHCRRGSRVVDPDSDNMESLFCIAESLREAGVESVQLGDHVYGTEYIIRQIHWWLWQMYRACKPIDEPALGKPYEELFELLAAFSGRLGVVTTNYDLIAEYFAWKQGSSFSYPFGELLRHGQLQLLSTDKTCGSYIGTAGAGETPILCKLHGSVNYFDVNRREIDILGVTTSLTGDRKSIGQSHIQSNRPEILMVDCLWSLQVKYVDLVPAIIPPTYAKLQAYAWLRKTWATAFKLITNAKTLIFIGYSMPPSDGFMQAMLRSALAMRTQSDPLRVFAVDKARSSLERYQQLFAPLNLKIGTELQEVPFEDSLGFLSMYLQS